MGRAREAVRPADAFGAAIDRAKSGTINSTCADPEIRSSGRTLSWRLQCRGQLDADVAGHFEFDSPRHYTATVISQGRMAGVLISDVKTALEGERTGDCAK